MDYRRIVLGVCLCSVSVTLTGKSQDSSGVTVASMSAKQESAFQPNEVIFIQQYYSHAPKFFLDDVAKKEKELPAGVAASIVRGKPLPKQLISFIREAPTSLTVNLEPLPRSLERKVLGTRFLLLDARMVVLDMVHVPTTSASDGKK